MSTMADDSAFQPIQLTLPSLTPSLILEVLPYGLTLHRLYVQADGKTHDILIGPEDPHDHASQKYVNSIVGRYTNRLPVPSDGQGLPVEKNGVKGTVYPRSNEKPGVSLHGGQTGWDSLVWTPLIDPSQVQLFTPEELETIGAELTPPSGLVFTRTSEDGEEGFPGRVRVEVLVALAQPNNAQTERTYTTNLGSVILLYRAKLEEEDKVTPINLTQHWGFNLDASLQDTTPPSIKDHKLTISAQHIVELDPTTGLSTGNLLPVAGTPYAHAEKKTGKIGEMFPEGGYNEFYVFTREPSPIPTRIRASSLSLPALSTSSQDHSQNQNTNIVKQILDIRPDPATTPVTLSSEQSGLKLVFESNQSGVQLYTNNFATPSNNTRKLIHGGTSSQLQGDGYPPSSAAFLEFHAPLASWLHPAASYRGGEGGDDTVLWSGEVYNNFVRVDVLASST